MKYVNDGANTPRDVCGKRTGEGIISRGRSAEHVAANGDKEDKDEAIVWRPTQKSQSDGMPPVFSSVFKKAMMRISAAVLC